MLSINPNPHDFQPCYLPYRTLPTPPSSSPTTDLSLIHLLNMGGGQHSEEAPQTPSTTNNEVTQALEIARESDEGARDPYISRVLESAIEQIWAKVQAQPDSYIMTRDEFSVFNFFQYRFRGNKIGIAARKRYWDNTHGP